MTWIQEQHMLHLCGYWCGKWIIYYDAEQGQGNFQVVHAVADDHTDEQKAKGWLRGVAVENNNIKDMVLQDLWKNEDFLGAWTQWPGWGHFIVTQCKLLAIDLCMFQFPSAPVTPWLTKRL